MNSNLMIKECLDRLDNIVLRPRMTLSLSTYNRQTGTYSEQKSLCLATGFTLLRGMMALAGTGAAVYGAVQYLRYKERRKIRRALKKRNCKDEKVTKP